MRIFVMFGTQDKRFDRLLNAILNSNFVNENEVHVQLGYTKGDYSGINGQEYYTEDELNHQIEIADLIITHAGVGAIVSALKLKELLLYLVLDNIRNKIMIIKYKLWRGLISRGILYHVLI